jgi:hypothetical protein
MKKEFLILAFLVSCSSAPSKLAINKSHLLQSESTESADAIKEGLTLGNNHLGAGYSAEVTLYTDALITAQEKEKGKMNMDPEDKTQKEIEKFKGVLTKNNTCFLFTVHTYGIEKAKFTNWVAKLKDSEGKLHEIQFDNVEGIKSVPATYEDINGRNWHNTSFGCTKTKLTLDKTFQIYLIPQIKNYKDQDETTVLTWEVI